MNKRMILSGGMLVFMAAIVAGGTGAFFSDTETSTGNVFTAGSVSIELLDVAHAYAGDDQDNAPVFDWMGGQGRFSLDDLKPLDTGNLVMNLENGANEAHVCAMIDGDPGALTDPEDQALYSMLNFYQDDGTQVVPGTWFDLGTAAPNGPVDTGVDYCFGEPNVDGTGLVSCDYGDGTIAYNDAQNGQFSADLLFYAIQTRNNAEFSCDQLTMGDDGEPTYTPVVSDDRPLVGAVSFAYAAPEPTSCDLTVDATVTSNTATEFGTLAAAEAVANDGDVICVDTGTYTENVTVDVENVTILGLNDPKGAAKATVDGQLTIDVDGVTVSGLEITNPDSSTGLLVRDVDNTTVSDNSFVDIGTTLGSGSAQAVYFVGNTGTLGSNGFTVTGNMIAGVGNPSKDGPGGSKGIYIGDSNDTGVVTGVVITDNMISNIKTLNSAFGDGGRGSHGILFNYGVSSTGSIDGAVVMNNSVSDINGAWARGVGLETNTPNTSVTRNDISDVVSPFGASDGVHFEGNPGGSTTVINENNFASSVVFGVSLNVVANQPAIAVDAENNWWGDTTPADDVLENAGTIDFDPFEASAFSTN